MIYFTSDLHLGHENALKHSNRPFSSVKEMNDILIANINAKVGPKDELWVLGDFAMKITREEVKELRDRIRCKHVHLVIGNHDKDYSEDGIFESIQHYAHLKTDIGKVILFHYPIEDWNSRHHGSIHLHGHIHSDGEYNEINRNTLLEETTFVGHKSKQDGLCVRRYDVGVDANNYFPVSLDEIFNYFDIHNVGKIDD